MAERVQAATRNRPAPGGFGWYRFDGISFDGRFVLIAVWHTGFLFSPRYYDEVLELRDSDGVQPQDGVDLADPTNHGAFGFALYDRGHSLANLIVEAPLVRGGSDPWFSKIHAGEVGIPTSPPDAGSVLGVGENRVVREEDGGYRLDFADRSKWTRTRVEGSLTIRVLTGGSDPVPLDGEAGGALEGHAWQILASRTEVTGTIRWSGPMGRRVRAMEFQGLGYLDRTAGRLPLRPHVGRWLWGRFQGSEKTIAYFRLDPDPSREPGGAAIAALPEPRTFLFHGDRNGCRLIPGGVVAPAQIRRNRWGMPHPLAVEGAAPELCWRAKMLRVVDRGPFFVRGLSRLNCADEALDGVVGITECFLPARWDVPLYRLATKGRIRRGP